MTGVPSSNSIPHLYTGMSLASFVSWRDSLFIVPGHPPGPTALENGCLVKVKHSGLWLFGVVKDIRTDTHPGVAAVEMV